LFKPAHHVGGDVRAFPCPGLGHVEFARFALAAEFAHDLGNRKSDLRPRRVRRRVEHDRIAVLVILHPRLTVDLLGGEDGDELVEDHLVALGHRQSHSAAVIGTVAAHRIKAANRAAAARAEHPAGHRLDLREFADAIGEQSVAHDHPAFLIHQAAKVEVQRSDDRQAWQCRLDHPVNRTPQVGAAGHLAKLAGFRHVGDTVGALLDVILDGNFADTGWQQFGIQPSGVVFLHEFLKFSGKRAVVGPEQTT